MSQVRPKGAVLYMPLMARPLNQFPSTPLQQAQADADILDFDDVGRVVVTDGGQARGKS